MKIYIDEFDEKFNFVYSCSFKKVCKLIHTDLTVRTLSHQAVTLDRNLTYSAYILFAFSPLLYSKEVNSVGLKILFLLNVSRCGCLTKGLVNL